MRVIYEILLALVMLATSFGIGWIAHKPAPLVAAAPQTTKTETKVVEHIVRQVVSETVHEVSGKTIQRVTETTTEQKTQDTAVAKAKPQPLPEDLIRPSWSIGALWQTRLDPKPSGVEVGYRTLGNVWVSGQFDWVEHSAKAGLRWEF